MSHKKQSSLGGRPTHTLDQGEDFYWGIMPFEDLQKQQRGKKRGEESQGEVKKKRETPSD